MEKKQLKERENEILALALAFCNEHLDEECTELCTKLVQKLGRKRSCPLQSGKVEIWAAAVVYTICSVNSMFSKGSRFFTSSSEICNFFGVKSTTVSQKSRMIKDLLDISNVFDPEFSLKEMAAHNPINRLFTQGRYYFVEDKDPKKSSAVNSVASIGIFYRLVMSS